MYVLIGSSWLFWITLFTTVLMNYLWKEWGIKVWCVKNKQFFDPQISEQNLK